MPKKYKGISRIDSAATHGWFVRLYRNGTTHPKFFADRKSGGKGKALKLALEHYEKLNKKLGARTALPRIMTKNRSNKSGVVGVSKSSKTSTSGKLMNFYVVTWRPEPRVSRNRTFRIDIVGDKKAFEAAVKFRRQMEKMILNAGRNA